MEHGAGRGSMGQGGAAWGRVAKKFGIKACQPQRSQATLFIKISELGFVPSF